MFGCSDEAACTLYLFCFLLTQVQGERGGAGLPAADHAEAQAGVCFSVCFSERVSLLQHIDESALLYCSAVHCCQGDVLVFSQISISAVCHLPISNAGR